MRRKLPLHWLIFLNIFILSCVFIIGGLATWSQLQQASLHNATNLVQSRATTEWVSHSLQELLPLHLGIKELNRILQQFKYEFTLLYLDSKWSRTSFTQVSNSLKQQKAIILRYWPGGHWVKELAEVRENLGIILDISQEAQNSKNPGELPQLYRDTELPLVTTSRIFEQLEIELTKSVSVDYEQAQQSSEITVNNIQEMSDIFTKINRNTLIIFTITILIMVIIKLFFMRELHYRIQILAQYSAKVAKGQFTAKLPLYAKDSTGKLAQALRAMAREIQSTRETVQILNASLERKVEERTAELQNANQEILALNERLKQEKTLIESELQLTRRLQQAEDARQTAEIANKAKSAFLANMSHELRTPLNGILGYTQILARDPDITAKQQEGIEIIQRSGEYLLTLINDVLDLSKVEAGKLDLYVTDFNFNDFIQGITELFQMRAHQKGITFRYQALSPLPNGIQADEKRLRQVLINLLGNAVKFTDQGEVTLKVGYHEGKMRFQVEDNGCGIAPGDIDKIFQPFQQVGEQKRQAEGTGLGLPITKRLIEMMGGTLHVDSVLGKGSIFWTALEFPEVEITQTTSTKQPNIKGFQGDTRTLLVIDDKRENRLVMVNLLTPLGFKVVEASDGQTGIAQASQLQPDLIFVDLVMPGMDGFTTTRQLRTIPTLEKIPIIAVSASVFEFHQQKSIEAGCNAFLPKPIRIEPLLGLLQAQLDLTWIYEESTATALERVTATDVIIPPPPQQISVLFNLAMSGDIQGILEILEELETDEKLLPFVKKVYQLAKNFEEEKICELIEQYVTRIS